jgi:hypothetical protein
VITVIAELPQYEIISGSIAAISNGANAGGTSLFAYLQKTGAAPADPFYLVEISVGDGNVVSAALAGSVTNLPWSLEYQSA